MRTHAQIVADATPKALADLRQVSIHTARSWGQRDSIPADQWVAIVDAGLATLEELALGAAKAA